MDKNVKEVLRLIVDTINRIYTNTDEEYDDYGEYPCQEKIMENFDKLDKLLK